MVTIANVTDPDFILKLIDLVAVSKEQSLRLAKKSAVS